MSSLIDGSLSALLDVSCKAIVLAILAAVCLFCLRIRDSNIRHRVWTAVLLAMLMLPALAWVTPSVLLPKIIATPWAYFIDNSNRVELTAVADGKRVASRPSGPAESAVALKKIPKEKATHQMSKRAGKQQQASTFAWAKWMFAVYTVGLTTLLGRLCLAIWSARRLAKQAQTIPSLGSGRYDIAVSEAVRVPLTVGIIRPRVLLPTDWSSWSAEMLASVLRHEQAHIDRRDPLVALLAEINRCVYWFHPLAWLLRKRLATLAEHSCDDSVIATTGDRTEYARHLVDVACRMSGVTARVAPLGVSMARTSQVESRVDAILDAERPLAQQMGGRRVTVLAAVILPVVLLTACARTVDNDVSTNREKSVAKASENAQALAMSGYRMTAEEAESLEKQTTQNPRDTTSRTKLLGYYSRKRFQKQSAREAAQKHILWLILNSPESEVLAIPEGHLNPTLDAEAYFQGKKAWLDQVESEPENLRLLEHSSSFFLSHDRNLAEEALQKAQSLDKDNPKWPNKLGHLYLLDMLTNSLKPKKEAAEKALDQFEIAYELSTDNVLLQYLAKAALAANKLTKAKGYAETMLSQSGSGWNYGNNIHHGNAILGRVALALDDVEEAKERLIESGKTPGSPQLDSFGPSMALAKELLQKGEKDIVLEYFELCSKFWKRGKTRLDEWSAVVKDGMIPDFGSKLYY